MKNETYKMNGVCDNCGGRQIIEIKKGHTAKGKRTCETCGCLSVETTTLVKRPYDL